MTSIHQAEATRAPTFWAAPDLAKVGYPVFPVGPDKHPSVRGGFYAATRDISQIAAWIEEGRADHDIAMPTGRNGHASSPTPAALPQAVV
jgi:hypothetical protein